jgi:Tol biopolymer transport system component
VDDDDCHLAVLRFPDQLTVLSPERAERGAETSSPHPATSCGFTFAKDGSAFVRAPWQGESFDVVRLDGTSHTIPFAGEVSSWSPGGNWLANIRCDSHQCRTTIMRPDGSDRRELEGEPVWSSDDRVLAVARPGVVMVGKGDGTDLREIGTFPRPGGWSPDGSTFVFVRDGDAWLAGADGSSERNLTEFQDGGVTAAWWSPDGTWIAVLQGSTIWMISPDGSVRQRLSEDALHGYANWGPEWAPAWSPDGEWVALEQEGQVTLFHAGDWRGVRLENAFQPAWSLDGRHLAVVADVNGQYHVDVMNADGTGRVTVTNSISSPPIAWFQ